MTAVRAGRRSATQISLSEPSLPEWSAVERESFFSAIARRRRAAWRVTVVSTVANLALAVLVAALMSPLFYAVLCLALELVNLAIPTRSRAHSRRWEGGTAFAPWAAHLCVAHSGTRDGLIGSSLVPMFPSPARRLRAL